MALTERQTSAAVCRQRRDGEEARYSGRRRCGGGCVGQQVGGIARATSSSVMRPRCPAQLGPISAVTSRTMRHHYRPPRPKTLPPPAHPCRLGASEAFYFFYEIYM
uniref:Uncharacterized protein n=1 Tax=Oryza nivara TaxID=4536 RepID=A0A0E0I874_ORYNI